VTHLILRIASENGAVPELLALFDNGEKLNLEEFKLELYTSFVSEEEAIGLDLINALKAIIEKFEEKPDLFVHHSRIGNNAPRWNEGFVKEKILASEGAKKIWVCGPPLMQEIFDRASEGLI